ncbi:PP2C family protein-serine/threonine phosphatase [Janthinobacterium sp. NFX145]|uniref:PP2C family protein-serine/threonine phosphatase n=1 Tax=Janthinobacterium sp. NFX145 TaxID=3415602 RepID=UPI003CC5923D
MIFEISKYSNSGPYAKNEDSYVAKILSSGGVVGVVADGVGGESAGEVASAFVSNKFFELVAPNFEISLGDVVREINLDLIEYVKFKGLPARVYTTLTGILISDDGVLVGVHTGDSRALVLRDQGILQLTDDHTEAHRLLREGKLRKDEYKNYPRKHVLESAMGMSSIPFIQDFHFKLKSNDRVLLISDGIYNKVSKAEIRDASIFSKTVDEFVNLVVEKVIGRVPDDNFTIVAFQAL